MVIQHNIPAMTAQRNLGRNQNAISGNLEKLSTGYQINRAADNAAGLAISEKMRCQITNLDAAQSNVKDGINFINIGDGGMAEIHDIINRMDELAVLSANGTFDNEVDRHAMQLEIDELIGEINRIADATNFNGIFMLNGSGEMDFSTTGSGSLTPVSFDIDTSLVEPAGDFTIIGGVEGVDFSYTSGSLTILSDTPMKIEGGNGTDNIVVDSSTGSANIILKDVTVSSAFGGLDTGNNDVHLQLEGSNSLISTSSNYAGLNIGPNGSVTIDGDGSLYVQGGAMAAGIGSGSSKDAGDITINGGNITVSAGSFDAGIGTGINATVGDIVINGGNVTVTGGHDGSGIGAGLNGSTGDIIITGGTVVATGGSGGAGIGSGNGTGTTGNVYITGGTVIATGGNGAAGIGTGQNSSVSDIYVDSDANVTATGGAGADDIGKGVNGTVGKVVDNSSDYTGTIILQIGDTNDDFNQLKVPIFDLHAYNLDIDPFDISTQDSALASMNKALDAVNQVSGYRACYGALSNRLEHTLDILGVMEDNIQDAESTIRDTDMAEEMMEYTKNNILIQSSQSMLAHANALPEGALQLLG